jgi:hypothetical protein
MSPSAGESPSPSPARADNGRADTSREPFDHRGKDDVACQPVALGDHEQPRAVFFDRGKRREQPGSLLKLRRARRA